MANGLKILNGSAAKPRTGSKNVSLRGNVYKHYVSLIHSGQFDQIDIPLLDYKNNHCGLFTFTGKNKVIACGNSKESKKCSDAKFEQFKSRCLSNNDGWVVVVP